MGKCYTSEADNTCPVMIAQKILSGKWSLAILYYLGQGTMRFGELQRKLPFLAQATLSRQLKELVNLGIVNRKDYQEIPPHVDYSLTEIGLKLLPVVSMLESWSNDYREYAKYIT